MTIYRPMSLKSLISRENVQLSPAQLGYMSGRARNQAHGMVLKLFENLSSKGEVTRAFLAKRLGKKPEQVTRWLGAPGNWTIDTLSDLLAGMGYAPVFTAQRLDELNPGNYYHPLAAAITRAGSGIKNLQSASVEVDVIEFSYIPGLEQERTNSIAASYSILEKT